MEFLTINGCLWQPKDILAGIRRGNSWCLLAGCNVCYFVYKWATSHLYSVYRAGKFWCFFLLSLSLSLSLLFPMHSCWRADSHYSTLLLVNQVVMCVRACVCAVRVRVCVGVGVGGGGG